MEPESSLPHSQASALTCYNSQNNCTPPVEKKSCLEGRYAYGSAKEHPVKSTQTHVPMQFIMKRASPIYVTTTNTTLFVTNNDILLIV